MNFITHYLVGYDTKDSKRCLALNNLLKSFGFQQLRSFFEAEITPAQFRKLKERIDKIIDRKLDCVIIYPLSKQNIFSKLVMGKLNYKIQRIF